MMNTYFEQGGFYNGTAATTAEPQAYRFPQSLLVPPYGPGPTPRNAHESTPYGDTNGGGNGSCKLYAGGEANFKAECLAKEQNGFSQAVKDMVNWPAMARAANEQMRSFATRIRLPPGAVRPGNSVVKHRRRLVKPTITHSTHGWQCKVCIRCLS
ncbi:hypothetical protein HNY73_001109 [Argiope bruennichi]|uniref:Uncharacterized protein n=1 Tax=Argiope bruennichi TaxID=94029 RepID=A0A8T0G2U4_ARGBR|nr:hypothetical protein HNY73_001109 [Argiope bruennichi]